VVAFISILALCVSCVALWKGHLAPFSPLILAGDLSHRVYPIRNREQHWYISSFIVPISVTNPGARPGIVTGLRLRLHYPELPFTNNYEFVLPVCELRPDKVNRIDKERFEWIDEVVAADGWTPFVVLPKATVAKHLMLEVRWDTPVIQKRITTTLELQVDWRTKWLTEITWELALPPKMWVDLVNGASFVYPPHKGQVHLQPECSPSDLHKYTGTKSALPTEGVITAAEPSFLDGPDSEEDGHDSRE
jgi:hypothetical protein